MKNLKKLTVFALIAAMVCCTVFCVPASAVSINEEVVSVEYLENGDYIETVITCEAPTGSAEVNAATKTASKTKSYKNSSGAVMWSVTVKGTFTYDGTSSRCTSCSHSTTAPGTGWSIKSASHSKAGNTATANATATHKDGLASTDHSMSVKITCSIGGTIS